MGGVGLIINFVNIGCLVNIQNTVFLYSMYIEYEIQELVWEHRKNRNPRLRKVQIWKTFLIGFDLSSIAPGFIANPAYRVIYRKTKKPIPQHILEKNRWLSSTKS